MERGFLVVPEFWNFQDHFARCSQISNFFFAGVFPFQSFLARFFRNLWSNGKRTTSLQLPRSASPYISLTTIRRTYFLFRTRDWFVKSLDYSFHPKRWSLSITFSPVRKKHELQNLALGNVMRMQRNAWRPKYNVLTNLSLNHWNY